MMAAKQYDKIVINGETLHTRVVDMSISRFMYMPQYWHKIIVENADGESRDVVLHTLMDAVHPYDFIPVHYKTDEEEGKASFLMKSAGPALVEFCRQELIVPHPDASKLRSPFLLTIILNELPVMSLKIDIQANINCVLKKRFDKTSRTLDLERFYQDPDLNEFCSLSQQKLMYFVLHLARELRVLHVKLADNSIDSLKPFETLVKKKNWNEMASIDLRKNKIVSAKELHILKTFPIKELNLDENPICNHYGELEYIRTVHQYIPTVTNLDGFDVSADEIAPSKRNFLCMNSCQGLIDSFLEHFFTLYDAADRRQLGLLYNSEAVFTLTQRFITHQKSSQTAKLTGYQKYARNIKQMANFDNSNERCFKGRESIMQVLTSLPPTEHDPSTFCVDLTCYKEKMLVLTVTGIYKHEADPASVVGNGSFNFMRTFIVSPTDDGTYEIVNDMLNVMNATTLSEARAFDPDMGPELKYMDIAVPTDDAGKRDVLEAFMEMTSMKRAWAIKCLLECGYNFKNSMSLFMSLFKTDKLPSAAFDMDPDGDHSGVGLPIERLDSSNLTTPGFGFDAPTPPIISAAEVNPPPIMFSVPPPLPCVDLTSPINQLPNRYNIPDPETRARVANADKLKSMYSVHTWEPPPNTKHEKDRFEPPVKKKKGNRINVCLKDRWVRMNRTKAFALGLVPPNRLFDEQKIPEQYRSEESEDNDRKGRSDKELPIKERVHVTVNGRRQLMEREKALFLGLVPERQSHRPGSKERSGDGGYKNEEVRRGSLENLESDGDNDSYDELIMRSYEIEKRAKFHLDVFDDDEEETSYGAPFSGNRPDGERREPSKQKNRPSFVPPVHKDAQILIPNDDSSNYRPGVVHHNPSPLPNVLPTPFGMYQDPPNAFRFNFNQQIPNPAGMLNNQFIGNPMQPAQPPLQNMPPKNLQPQAGLNSRQVKFVGLNQQINSNPSKEKAPLQVKQWSVPPNSGKDLLLDPTVTAPVGKSAKKRRLRPAHAKRKLKREHLQKIPAGEENEKAMWKDSKATVKPATADVSQNQAPPLNVKPQQVVSMPKPPISMQPCVVGVGQETSLALAAALLLNRVSAMSMFNVKPQVKKIQKPTINKQPPSRSDVGQGQPKNNKAMKRIAKNKSVMADIQKPLQNPPTYNVKAGTMLQDKPMITNQQQQRVDLNPNREKSSTAPNLSQKPLGNPASNVKAATTPRLQDKPTIINQQQQKLDLNPIREKSATAPNLSQKPLGNPASNVKAGTTPQLQDKPTIINQQQQKLDLNPIREKSATAPNLSQKPLGNPPSNVKDKPTIINQQQQSNPEKSATAPTLEPTRQNATLLVQQKIIEIQLQPSTCSKVVPSLQNQQPVDPNEGKNIEPNPKESAATLARATSLGNVIAVGVHRQSLTCPNVSKQTVDLNNVSKEVSSNQQQVRVGPIKKKNKRKGKGCMYRQRQKRHNNYMAEACVNRYLNAFPWGKGTENHIPDPAPQNQPIRKLPPTILKQPQKPQAVDLDPKESPALAIVPMKQNTTLPEDRPKETKVVAKIQSEPTCSNVAQDKSAVAVASNDVSNSQVPVSPGDTNRCNDSLLDNPTGLITTDQNVKPAIGPDGQKQITKRGKASRQRYNKARRWVKKDKGNLSQPQQEAVDLNRGEETLLDNMIAVEIPTSKQLPRTCSKPAVASLQNQRQPVDSSDVSEEVPNNSQRQPNDLLLDNPTDQNFEPVIGPDGKLAVQKKRRPRGRGSIARRRKITSYWGHGPKNIRAARKTLPVEEQAVDPSGDAASEPVLENKLLLNQQADQGQAVDRKTPNLTKPEVASEPVTTGPDSQPLIGPDGELATPRKRQRGGKASKMRYNRAQRLKKRKEKHAADIYLQTQPTFNVPLHNKTTIIDRPRQQLFDLIKGKPKESTTTPQIEDRPKEAKASAVEVQGEPTSKEAHRQPSTCPIASLQSQLQMADSNEKLVTTNSLDCQSKEGNTNAIAMRAEPTLERLPSTCSNVAQEKPAVASLQTQLPTSSNVPQEKSVHQLVDSNATTKLNATSLEHRPKEGNVIAVEIQSTVVEALQNQQQTLDLNNVREGSSNSQQVPVSSGDGTHSLDDQPPSVNSPTSSKVPQETSVHQPVDSNATTLEHRPKEGNVIAIEVQSTCPNIVESLQNPQQTIDLNNVSEEVSSNSQQLPVSSDNGTNSLVDKPGNTLAIAIQAEPTLERLPSTCSNVAQEKPAVASLEPADSNDVGIEASINSPTSSNVPQEKSVHQPVDSDATMKQNATSLEYRPKEGKTCPNVVESLQNQQQTLDSNNRSEVSSNSQQVQVSSGNGTNSLDGQPEEDNTYATEIQAEPSTCPNVAQEKPAVASLQTERQPVDSNDLGMEVSSNSPTSSQEKSVCQSVESNAATLVLESTKENAALLEHRPKEGNVIALEVQSTCPNVVEALQNQKQTVDLNNSQQVPDSSDNTNSLDDQPEEGNTHAIAMETEPTLERLPSTSNVAQEKPVASLQSQLQPLDSNDVGMEVSSNSPSSSQEKSVCQPVDSNATTPAIESTKQNATLLEHRTKEGNTIATCPNVVELPQNQQQTGSNSQPTCSNVVSKQTSSNENAAEPVHPTDLNTISVQPFDRPAVAWFIKTLRAHGTLSTLEQSQIKLIKQLSRVKKKTKNLKRNENQATGVVYPAYYPTAENETLIASLMNFILVGRKQAINDNTQSMQQTSCPNPKKRNTNEENDRKLLETTSSPNPEQQNTTLLGNQSGSSSLPKGEPGTDNTTVIAMETHLDQEQTSCSNPKEKNVTSLDNQTVDSNVRPSSNEEDAAIDSAADLPRSNLENTQNDSSLPKTIGGSTSLHTDQQVTSRNYENPMAAGDNDQTKKMEASMQPDKRESDVFNNEPKEGIEGAMETLPESTSTQPYDDRNTEVNILETPTESSAIEDQNFFAVETSSSDKQLNQSMESIASDESQSGEAKQGEPESCTCNDTQSDEPIINPTRSTCLCNDLETLERALKEAIESSIEADAIHQVQQESNEVASTNPVEATPEMLDKPSKDASKTADQTC